MSCKKGNPIRLLILPIAVLIVLACNAFSQTMIGRADHVLAASKVSYDNRKDTNTVYIKSFLSNRVSAIARHENVLFAVNLNLLFAFDISDPLNPVVLDSLLWWNPIDQKEFSFGMYYHEGLLYVSGPKQGLLVYDVSNPRQMELINTVYFEENGGITTIRRYNDVLIISDPYTVYTFKITDTGNPVYIARTPMYSANGTIHLGPPLGQMNDILFVEERDSLKTMRITEDGYVVPVSVYPEFGYIPKPAIGASGNTVFIAIDRWWLNKCEVEAYSVGENMELSKLSAIETSGDPVSFYFRGDTVYELHMDNSHFRVYDYSNKLQPKFIAKFSAPWGSPAYMEFVGEYIYLTTDFYGIAIIKLGATTPTEVATQPHSFALQPVYPNPITYDASIPFTIRRKQHVQLEMYNSLGLKVRTLYDGVCGPGEYMEHLNTKGLPAGAYQVVLRSQDGIRHHTVAVR